MAIVALRPSADKSKGHTPSSGNQCFPMVNETKFDNDATYIYQNVSSISNSTLESILVLSKPNISQGNFVVNSCSLHIQTKASDYGECSGNCQVLPNGSNHTLRIGDRAYVETVIDNPIPSLLNKEYNTSSFPELQVKVVTNGALTNIKDSSFQIRIGQIYLELTYEVKVPVPVGTGGYIKNNTSWVEIKEVYLKQNGQWILQSKENIPIVLGNKKYVRK